MFKLIVQELRPKQWVKNLVIVLPAVFTDQLFKMQVVEKLLVGFFLFSFTAGSLYIINDVVDREKDRLHPEKSQRPIASGQLPIPLALIISFTLLAATFVVSFMNSLSLLFVVIGYATLVVIYSFILKRAAILDMVAIAAGFVLRVVGGALLINVPPSSWIIVTTFFFALFFVACKRRLELNILDHNARNHRLVLQSYSPEFSNILLAVTGAVTILSYSIYTLEESVVSRLDTEYLIYTVPFVMIIVLRLIMVALADGSFSSDPTNIITKDQTIILSLICWFLSVVCIIYL